MQPGRVVEEFPAPEFRGAQRQALADIQAAFDAGNDVVLVRAPTGSGKSLLARAIMGCARRAADADPSDAVGAYYTTPQVSQLDDVAADDLLEEFKLIRGSRTTRASSPARRRRPWTARRAPASAATTAR